MEDDVKIIQFQIIERHFKNSDEVEDVCYALGDDGQIYWTNLSDDDEEMKWWLTMDRKMEYKKIKKDEI